MTRMFVVLLGLFLFTLEYSSHASHFVRLAAKDKYERSAIVDLGLSIEAIRSDSVYGIASESVFERVKQAGVPILETFELENVPATLDFPAADARFHNYAELTKTLDDLVAANPKLMRKFSIGKSLQGRDIWAVQINTSTNVLRSKAPDVYTAKPGAIFMGNHHAREHVSAEIPLMMLEYFAKNYGIDKQITNLLDHRDITVIPMVNPDGVEHDIESGQYVWQRKNMRPTDAWRPGVDLNRNYGYMWNHGGASKDPSSDIYMGPEPFSEPETRAVRDFVTSKKANVRTLLSFHTFSELILYPWGHTNDKITDKDDREIFESMAHRMAQWNGYKPQQSSELYIASGDTVDWAYGTHHMYAFTFELSPKELWNGGFYPGAGILDQVFQDNLKPVLYMIEVADNPKRVIKKRGARTEVDPGLMWLEEQI